MLNRLDLRGVIDARDRLPRPSVAGEGPLAAVREILAAVRDRGDAAILELTERFDGVRLDHLRVPQSDIDAALAGTRPELRRALELARDRIRAHHETQLRPETVHEADGVRIRSYHRPVERAGCYVPGGRAAYPSTLLMTAVPAQVAGVPQVAVCVPPDRGIGAVTPITLAAAAIAGVEEVYAIGGAQAIGALAYGTDQVVPVDVICGPGNRYVALAQQEVAGTVGVAAAFAGPSEVVVVADDSVRPELAAVDVILQAEHGPDGLAWLVTWDEQVLDAVDDEIARLLEKAPRREEITATLAEGGHGVLVDGPAQALVVSDLVATEHLELMCRDAEAMAASVRNAGAIFVGAWSPASIGDYLAGPSHVLPTHGTARFSSALTVDDFLKHHHVISVSADGFDRIGPAVVSLAEAEGLDAHAESIRIRQGLRTHAPLGDPT
ncbi:MAG: histidinol dehydrogenase [Actinobacteria bacterium]|nr:histidinol dehydrogenase [Actinomycetota bacterium]